MKEDSLPEGLEKLESLVSGVEGVDRQSAVYKSVNDLTDYSVKRTLMHLLTALKNDVDNDRLTMEGNRFLLLSIAGNLAQFNE